MEKCKGGKRYVVGTAAEIAAECLRKVTTDGLFNGCVFAVYSSETGKMISAEDWYRITSVDLNNDRELNLLACWRGKYYEEYKCISLNLDRVQKTQLTAYTILECLRNKSGHVDDRIQLIAEFTE